MLKIETLRKNYLDKVLESAFEDLQGAVKWRVFTDTGDYEKATRSHNSVTQYVNGLFTVTGSSVSYAGTEQEIVSVTTQLELLFPLGDNPEVSTDETEGFFFDSAQQIRERLSAAFSSADQKFNVEEKQEDGTKKTYSVVAGYTLPATGVRQQRSMVGDSLTYSCTVYFAYLSNAVNTSDVKISIDNYEVPFLAFQISRRPSLAANLYSKSQNGEATSYAENAAFVIDLTLPGFVDFADGLIANYLLGITPANDSHIVDIVLDGKSVERRMIFGESSAAGQGIENIVYRISLIPYFWTGNTWEAGG